MKLKLAMFMLSTSAISLYATGGYHTFENQTSGEHAMDFHVSVLYVAGTRTDKGIVYHKGAVDKNGKLLSNRWTAKGALLCVKRVDIRKAGSDSKLAAIRVFNTDTPSQGENSQSYGERTGAFNHTVPTITCSKDSHWVFSYEKAESKKHSPWKYRLRMTSSDLPMYWDLEV